MIKPIIKFDSRGTTLVEAMVAVVILSMGLIPSLLVILLANSFSSTMSNNLIAANLAQEGVEIIRAMRDENEFSGRDFDYGLANCGQSTCVWRAEWNSTSLITETVPGTYLTIDANGVFSYSGSGMSTGFTRRILITKDPSSPGCDCEIRVTVEITWPERRKIQTISVESHLYDLP